MRMRLGNRWTVLLASVALAACASAPGGARGSSSGSITAEQLDNLGPGVSAYEAIERLRPTWLRDRGVNSASAAYVDDTMPKVHIDRTPFGLDALRSFRTTDIQTITFMSGPDATTMYGTGYVNGLILVQTRSGGSRPPGGE
jgi:hypothetical protein